MSLRPFAVFLLAVTGVLLAQTAPAHKPAAKKTAAKKTTAPVRKTGTTVARASSSTTKKRTVAAKRVAAPPRQLAPTADRYKEIQSALAAKGYLKSEPNGVWDAQSQDAMKRYQVDQKQQPTGKLTAASLIGLGLGPKTALMGAAPVSPAESAAETKP